MKALACLVMCASVALDQRTGRLLWEFQAGGAIRANPVSFLIDGRQCVAIAGTHALFVFGLEGLPLAERREVASTPDE